MSAMQPDPHLLFFNVFGFAIVNPDKITVSLNIHKSGKIQGRMLEKELETPLPMVTVPVLIPFGAWVQDEEIYLTPGRLYEYDAEVFETNKEIITETINAALRTILGAVT